MALFGKAKVADALVADAAPVIEVTPELRVTVVAIAPLSEGDGKYEIGQKFTTSESRARRLIELNLVRPFDASAPPPPRLASAKAAANDGYTKLNICTREVSQAEREVENAKQRVVETETSIAQAADLSAVKTHQAALTDALTNLEASRRLLANAKSRATQAQHAEADAQRTLRQIENRIAELTGALIPSARKAVERQEKEIADLEQKISFLQDSGIRNAQAEVAKLQAELAFLE
jgi:hypothetical protein